MSESNLADRIRLRLKALGLTPNAASTLCGRPRDYIGELLATFDKGGSVNPRNDILQSLAKGLECDFQWLATGEGTPDGPGQRSRGHQLIDEISDQEYQAALTLLEAIRVKGPESPSETGS